MPFTVDPIEEHLNPCQPSPCGANAVCKERNGAGSCTCLPEYFGDPYSGCRPECVTNSDCDRTKACVNNKCRDPCPGVCGINAECAVHNHAPNCACLHGYTGDASRACHLIEIAPTPVPVHPCNPSPCGANSICREQNGHAICTCQADFIGSPPNCKPECVVSSECPQNRACINQKCADPCPGTCGVNANCQVVNHNPICSCRTGYTGDPFIECHIKQDDPSPSKDIGNPCIPSPCGPNSQCRIIGEQGVCTCIPNYVGRPPNCRPECVINSECPSNLACINEKCADPCPGSCGINSLCSVVKHSPVCSCPPGYEGNPLTQCSVMETPPIQREPASSPCVPSPCGGNAECRERNGAGACYCLSGFEGNPYEGCKRECETNSDCSSDRACVRNKCVDPCAGVCGVYAVCRVRNHVPDCTCPDGLSGDPFVQCHEIAVAIPPRTPENPCVPSPCGPNSQCRNLNGQAVCSCTSGYLGSPPQCRPECVVSSECAIEKACVNQKCTDPCPGICGHNAKCRVSNHSPICSCNVGYSGDPFVQCSKTCKLSTQVGLSHLCQYSISFLDVRDEPVTEKQPTCSPSPCGPNSVCQMINGLPTCSCRDNYIGNPPNCRPECTINSECKSNEACINQKCRDPCPGTCGNNAECRVISHTVSCVCLEHYTGDPFVQCVLRQSEPINPCEPSPCGANAECIHRQGAGACKCIPDYFGNPYEGCRPECTHSSDCPQNKACVNNKCMNPCVGICGQNAECDVINHVPSCTCTPGYIGDPFRVCHLEPTQTPIAKLPDNPCVPSPCGPYSQCRESNGVAVCSCESQYIGSPPNCKPECTVNAECPQNKACHKLKCANPCSGTCGFNANCEVINHNPICSCPSDLTGDPFVRCTPAPKAQDPVVIPNYRNPCIPSPCGLNSECRDTNGSPSCSCKPGYIGTPPNCRPECVVNTDCPSHQACIAEKCRDPCQGSCGFNTECRVQNHIPNCVCRNGFTGDPFTQCVEIIERLPAPTQSADPCELAQCGPNTECHKGVCKCIPNYFGDPYVGCRPECTMNTDCSPNKACVNTRCIEPCVGTCGVNALCTVYNHIPSCSCPTSYIGDPFVSCRPEPVSRDPTDPCHPTPCGPNSHCRSNNGAAICTCVHNTIGQPPSCRHECVVSAECPLDRACLNYKCIDPCPGTCGQNARCQVINHNPICSCNTGFTGDPFTRCFEPAREEPQNVNPCIPSPCGPNSECKVVGESPACSCLIGYIGSPPSCRPECTINSECPTREACIRQKCTDPCPGSCGQNAQCSVINHLPICTCLQGYEGDPFVSCSEKRGKC